MQSRQTSVRQDRQDRQLRGREKETVNYDWRGNWILRKKTTSTSLVGFNVALSSKILFGRETSWVRWQEKINYIKYNSIGVIWTLSALHYRYGSPTWLLVMILGSLKLSWIFWWGLFRRCHSFLVPSGMHGVFYYCNGVTSSFEPS
jgi:hypothetical protein